MPMFSLPMSRFGTSVLSGVCAVSLLMGAAGCAGRGGSKASSMKSWMAEPSTHEKRGVKMYWPELGLTFEKPDTLYVFRECSEASHGKDSNGWIPIVVCSSMADQEGDEYSESAAETISVTFSITDKTRPLDERTVSWFENQYKENGFKVDDLTYQHDFQNKSGIYAKLQVVGSDGMPTHEIIQYMFSKKDVVFIARVEYPFGDSRAIDNDWKYLLWNFDVDPDLTEDDSGPVDEAPEEENSALDEEPEL